MTWKKLQRLLACLLAVLLLSQVGAFSPAVFAADSSGYTLHDGTAVIPAGTSAGDVNRILAAALVEGFGQMTADEQKAILDTGFEYECEGKSGLFTNTAWGSIGGFTSEKGKYIKTTYSHPALADNKDGDYKVRLAGTTAEVTLTKAEKRSSSIALKEGVSIALPYNDAGALDFDALRATILQQVVDEGTTPALTLQNTEIEYYASSALVDHKEWVKLEGEYKTIPVINKEIGYPAISAGEQQIRISFKGDNTYKASSETTTVTFTERADSHIVLKSGQKVALPYTDATTVDFDALRASILTQVVDEGTTPSLTAENTEIKYYATSSTGLAHEWVKLDGDKVNLATYPAISAGDQQIQISFKGDNAYKASSATTTVTFTERPGIEAVTKENPTFKLDFTADGAAIYDNIRQKVWDAVVVSTNPVLTVDNVTIEYYATATTGAVDKLGHAWVALTGGKVNGLTYPAIGEGTQQVRITWGGSKNYAAWQWQGNVVVTGREAAPFRLKQGVTEVSIVYKADQSIDYEATAQALREALIESTDSNYSVDLVKVEYNIYGTAITDDRFANYKDLSYRVLDSDLLDGIKAGKFGLGDQLLRLSWRGDADYKPFEKTRVQVKMVDNRQPTEVVLKPSISIVYNMDASVMKQNIFEYVIDWDDSKLPDKSTLSADDFTIEYYATAKVVAGDFSGDMDSFKGWVPIEGKGATIGELQLLYPQMGAGEQKIRVTYKGNADYSPSDAAELPDGCYLTVKKANVSVKVHSTSIYADEVPGKDFVTTDPADKFDIFTIYTGVSSVFVQLPERFTDNAFIKAVDPVLEKVGLRTIKDIMDKGITVGELKQSLDKIVNGDEYAAVRNVLKLMGIDVTTLQQIINVFNKITLLDNVRIALRTPDQVGIYTVYAVTNNDNYNTGFGMGALVVKKHYSGVKLTWNQNFTNGKISAADVAKFDFGATLSYDGNRNISQSNVKYLYSGFTSKWKPYSSTSTPPTEPGRYVMTVVTLGGNYQAAPITRSFQITK